MVRVRIADDRRDAERLSSNIEVVRIEAQASVRSFFRSQSLFAGSIRSDTSASSSHRRRASSSDDIIVFGLSFCPCFGLSLGDGECIAERADDDPKHRIGRFRLSARLALREMPLRARGIARRIDGACQVALDRISQGILYRVIALGEAKTCRHRREDLPASRIFFGFEYPRQRTLHRRKKQANRRESKALGEGGQSMRCFAISPVSCGMITGVLRISHAAPGPDDPPGFVLA